MTGAHPTLHDWLALLADPALVVSTAGEVVAINARFIRIAGNRAVGRRLDDIVSVAADDLAENLRTWARNKQPVTGALRLRTEIGEVEADVHAGRLSGPTLNGQTALLLLVLKPRGEVTEAFRTLTEKVEALTREVSSRKRAEQELLALKDVLEERVASRTAQLSELAGRLIEAEETERRRLAHALHDNLQQMLVTASFQTDRLDSAANDPAVQRLSSGLRELIQECIGVCRSLTLDLSPPILYDAGLCAALAWLARRNREQHELEVTVCTDENAEPVDEQIRMALFTAARELLFNIVKHANVDAATLSLLRAEDGRLVLRVRDEGSGFDLAEIEELKRGDGFGLFSLRERVELLGGEMRTDTAPGRGTTVEVIIPDGHPGSDRLLA
jgi:signal transduction histidine kinase